MFTIIYYFLFPFIFINDLHDNHFNKPVVFIVPNLLGIYLKQTVFKQKKKHLQKCTV